MLFRSQERNPHDLMVDFEAEIPGYRHNRALVAVLEGLELRPGTVAIGANVLRCYEALVEASLISEYELPLIRGWLHDLDFVVPENQP